MAMKAAKKAAQDLGYRTVILSSLVEGETREVAKVHAAIAKEVLLSGNPIPPPACILSGGETTVTLKGKGKGGRNQEFALAAALEIAGWEEIMVLSAGTDGTDGPTDAAGAFADGKTVTAGEDDGSGPRVLSEGERFLLFLPKNGRPSDYRPHGHERDGSADHADKEGGFGKIKLTTPARKLE